MAEVLTVEIQAAVASFRLPTEVNYQRSLPAPPPTTLIGLAGAAMGAGEEELWDGGERGAAFPWHRLLVSVLIDHQPGVAVDLWQLRKFDREKKSCTRSPYPRELLFGPRYTAIYGGLDRCDLERLQDAFRSPRYALCLGRADDLARVVSCRIETATSVDPTDLEFEGTVLPATRQDIRIQPSLRPGLRLRPVLFERLPCGFTLVRGGARCPAGLRDFAFVPLGVRVRGRVARAFALGGRYWTWLNC